MLLSTLSKHCMCTIYIFVVNDYNKQIWNVKVENWISVASILSRLEIIMLQIFAIILFTNFLICCYYSPNFYYSHYSQVKRIIFCYAATWENILHNLAKTVSVTGADSDSDHSLVPELEQATLELEVDIDMMLTHTPATRSWQSETSNLALLAWPKLLMVLSPHALLVGGRGRPSPLIQVRRMCCQLLAFTLATILQLCFMLTLCYYSQNYSCIIIASLVLSHIMHLDTKHLVVKTLDSKY